MSEMPGLGLNRRLSTLSLRELSELGDALSAVRHGVAVERVSNAPLAVDVARWQIRHSGWRFVRQPGYLVVVLVLTTLQFLVRGAVVALLVAGALMASAIVVSHVLGRRAGRRCRCERAVGRHRTSAGASPAT